ncbi:SCP2 sterol-binding domain-containing protein [Halocatena salina]|uniref:SCP2 sterol-binding domain-containing protein n=1 Tax=Halocatena salina TaxID=2934340 RepID=A0A8U0A5V3_9EURY|nr:SCP2 sterol-binding domain-containing protein [Halocatena salina]UPM43297.1 SCP2 sterol-binding domain-containing protein [Halocatena salina]
MTTTDITQRIETVLDAPDDQLAAELPALLDEIEGDIEAVLLDNPALFAQITQRMEAVDIGAFATEHPKTVEQFQGMLWTGMGLLVRASPDVRESITEDISVNFEATDAPMTGHLEVIEDEQTIEGGTVLLDAPDLTIRGPADELVDLITGAVDPTQGGMQQNYQLDGEIQKGTQLAATMGQLTKLLPS